MLPLEYIFLGTSLLILFSVFSSKLSDRFSVPALLIFLFIGMAAGTEGLGLVRIHGHWIVQYVGITALIFIIFTGGVNTRWDDVRPVLGPGLALSTIGVLLTALILGFFAVVVLGVSPLEGFLMGAVLSSTDAAAVFSILRARKVGFKGGLRQLLEFESGSNDPMAVFLTIGIIRVIQEKSPLLSMLPGFFMEMGAGLILGLLFARVTLFILTKIRLQYDGIYPVLVLAMVLLSYAVANILHGNGFLTVYILGIVLGGSEFNRKRALLNFYDGIAWLMQIVMFLALGLLVLPSMIFANALHGLVIALALMFIARPLSVFVSLIGFNMTTQKKAMVSWVGLRGAAPIVLAAFPLMSGVPNAGFIFNIVFFVVIASVLIQGTTISAVADMLKVSAPYQSGRKHPLEFEKSESIDAMLVDIMVPYNSQYAGKTIFDLHAPGGSLIVLLARGDKYIVPSGATVIKEGDVILTLANKEALEKLRSIVTRLKEAQTE